MANHGYGEWDHTKCDYAEYRILFIILPNVIVLSFMMLNVIMLSVIVLSFINPECYYAEC